MVKHLYWYILAFALFYFFCNVTYFEDYKSTIHNSNLFGMNSIYEIGTIIPTYQN